MRISLKSSLSNPRSTLLLTKRKMGRRNKQLATTILTMPKPSSDLSLARPMSANCCIICSGSDLTASVEDPEALHIQTAVWPCNRTQESPARQLANNHVWSSMLPAYLGWGQVTSRPGIVACTSLHTANSFGNPNLTAD